MLESIKAHLPDPDHVLAYDTVKLVRVLDRRLGFVYLVCQLLILVYVVVYVFMISKKYLEEEKAQGWVLVKVMNQQLSDTGMPWDIYDRITNPGEQGAVFIPTRILITKGQTQNDEYCASPVHKCSLAQDCDIRNEKLQKAECVNGHCMRRQWCPAEDPNVATTETQWLEFDKVQLWFQTHLHFHKFRLDMSSAEEQESVPFPNERANTYRLKDLVQWTNVKAADIMENGAVMLVNVKLESPLTLNSERSVDVKVESHSVDTATGYNHVYNHYYYEGGVRKRDSYRMFGIRLMAFATGFAERISWSGIVLQLSSAIALMSCAESIADFYLMNVVPERKHYAEQKIVQTEDFNDDG